MNFVLSVPTIPLSFPIYSLNILNWSSKDKTDFWKKKKKKRIRERIAGTKHVDKGQSLANYLNLVQSIYVIYKTIYMYQYLNKSLRFVWAKLNGLSIFFINFKGTPQSTH